MLPNVGANLTRVEYLKKSNNSSFLIETCGSRFDFFFPFKRILRTFCVCYDYFYQLRERQL